MILVNSCTTANCPLPCCPLLPKKVMAMATASFDSIISDSNLLVQILGMLGDKEIGNLNSSISRFDCRNAFQTSLANTDALKMKGIDSRHTLTLLSYWRWIVNKKVAVTAITMFNAFTRWYAFIPEGFSRDCEAELATVMSDYLRWSWKKLFLKSVRLMECRFDFDFGCVERFPRPCEKNYNIPAHLIRSLAGNIVRGHATFGLRSLDLVSCILSRTDMKSVGILLKHNAESLQRVTISDLWDESDDDGLVVTMNIAEIINCGAQLKELTLSMNRHSIKQSPFRITPTCLLTICRRCPGLECVSLRGWRCSLINDAEALAEACTNLTSINLNGCCGTDADQLVTLVRSLCGSRLQRLYMCAFQKSMAFMAEECCTNLTHVDFGYSVLFCDANVYALVQNCKLLEFVKINKTRRVTGDAVFAIANSCSNLMELNIFECCVSKAAVLAVITQCMRLRTLFCTIDTRDRRRQPFVFHSDDRDKSSLIDDWEHSYDYYNFKFPDGMNRDIQTARRKQPCDFDMHSFFTESKFFSIANVQETSGIWLRWLESNVCTQCGAYGGGGWGVRLGPQSARCISCAM